MLTAHDFSLEFARQRCSPNLFQLRNIFNHDFSSVDPDFQVGATDATDDRERRLVALSYLLNRIRVRGIETDHDSRWRFTEQEGCRTNLTFEIDFRADSVTSERRETQFSKRDYESAI